MKYKILILASTTILTSSINSNAGTIDVSLDINITSNYADCEPITERIVTLVKSYINAEDTETREHYERKIKKKKKKLRKCEKDNKKWYKKLAAGIYGGSASYTTDF